ALYLAKQQRPALTIDIVLDWHRAQRGRIGCDTQCTNADWYCRMAQQHPDVEISIYGAPVNTREALGVLHLKGFIIDDLVIYSGASLNNVYLHHQGEYRYDRYHLLRNASLADTMVEYIQQHLLTSPALQRLDQQPRATSASLKNKIRYFRHQLRSAGYQFNADNCSDTELTVTPIVGLGKKNLLNKTIQHLLASTHYQVTLCTPYFNLPTPLVKRIYALLRKGISVEIIVGDKTANDFYIPDNEPFKIIGTLPYLYEINLRRFISRLQKFVNNGQLTVRLWKDGSNSYHLKGIWVDKQWLLITGNNLNPRAWNLDLENGILIHDPQQQLADQSRLELESIRTHTSKVIHYQQLDTLRDYPIKVRKLLQRLRRIRVDRLISRLL
ncbi:MAG: CDP-diacylglycerol--serine O-phosphatidyltransferase, partial [Enterobacteriaceae bacterium]